MLVKIGDKSHEVNDSVGLYIGQLEKKVVEHAKELKTIGDKAVKAVKEKIERQELVKIAQGLNITVDDKTTIERLRGIGDTAKQLEKITPTQPIIKGGDSDIYGFLADIGIGL